MATQKAQLKLKGRFLWRSNSPEKQLMCRRENEEAAVPAQTKVNDLLCAGDAVSK